MHRGLCVCLLLCVCAGFDYSRLSSSHKGLTGKKERESLSRKLKEDVDAAAAELAASAPNLKALEQYEAIRDKEKQQVRASSQTSYWSSPWGAFTSTD